MGFVRIFWKNNIQQAYLLKTSISGQIVAKILAQLCSDDSIQILLNLTQFITLGCPGQSGQLGQPRQLKQPGYPGQLE